MTEEERKLADAHFLGCLPPEDTMPVHDEPLGEVDAKEVYVNLPGFYGLRVEVAGVVYGLVVSPKDAKESSYVAQVWKDGVKAVQMDVLAGKDTATRLGRATLYSLVRVHERRYRHHHKKRDETRW